MNSTLFDDDFLDSCDICRLNADIEPKTIEEKFDEFHAKHPEVYEMLVKLAREWMSYGHSKLGIATLFEKLRWEWHVNGMTDQDGYKLNNNYKALYARKMMFENPELDGLFETRASRFDTNGES